MSEDILIKSFDDMLREAYGNEELDSDAYVEWLAKSGRLGGMLSKAAGDPGGVYYNGGPNWTRPSDNYPGYPNIGTSYSDLTPLRIQNLDATLTAVLYKRRNFVLWDWLEKTPTISTLYEYDKINSYGSGRSAGGFAEGGMPALSMPAYERDQANVRYIGVQRGVTQQSRMVGRAGGLMMDPVKTEVENGTFTLLEKITRSLYFGDSNVLDDQGNLVNYDGITAQIAAQNDPLTVIDLQGSTSKFGFSIFDNIATTLMEKGFVTDFGKINCFMNPRVLTDLSKMYYALGNASATNANNPALQRQMSNAPATWTPGTPIGGYDTDFGHFKFTPDVFLQAVPGNVPVSSPSPSANQPQPDPGAPSGSYVNNLGSIVAVAAADNASNLPAGSYYYWFAAVGMQGEAAPVAVNGGSAVVVTSGQGVHFTQSAGALGITGGYSKGLSATKYNVYRSTMSNPWSSGQWIDPNGGYIGSIVQPATTPGVSAILQINATGGNFVDRNSTIPGTGNILLLEGSTENLMVPMLTPLLKYNLPPVGTTEPFLLFIYHTIVYKAKRRAFWIKNVPTLG